MKLTVDCKPFAAKLTSAGCETNRNLALKAIAKLVKGHAISTLHSYELDRLAGCGQCPKIGADNVLSIEMIMDALCIEVGILADKVLREDYALDEAEAKAKRRIRWRRAWRVKQDKPKSVDVLTMGIPRRQRTRLNLSAKKT